MKEILLDKLANAKGSERAALLEYFHDRAFPEPNSGCWFWVGCTNNNPKPSNHRPIFTAHGSYVYAHRAAALLFKLGDIENALVCHHCDQPLCVNPDHLYIGDYQTNSDDKFRRNRFKVYKRTNVHKEQMRQVQPFADNKGSKNAWSKLTEADALEIYNSKEPTRILRTKFGVSRNTIQRIRAGQRWKHIHEAHHG